MSKKQATMEQIELQLFELEANVNDQFIYLSKPLQEMIPDYKAAMNFEIEFRGFGTLVGKGLNQQLARLMRVIENQQDLSAAEIKQANFRPRCNSLQVQIMRLEGMFATKKTEIERLLPIFDEQKKLKSTSAAAQSLMSRQENTGSSSSSSSSSSSPTRSEIKPGVSQSVRFMGNDAHRVRIRELHQAIVAKENQFDTATSRVEIEKARMECKSLLEQSDKTLSSILNYLLALSPSTDVSDLTDYALNIQSYWSKTLEKLSSASVTGNSQSFLPAPASTSSSSSSLSSSNSSSSSSRNFQN